MEVFYISFFIQGIDLTHDFNCKDKEEIWFTNVLFSCLTSSRLSFIVLSDSLYCSNCSWRSFSSLSFLWYWAIRILSDIEMCFIGFFWKEIKKFWLMCQFLCFFYQIFFYFIVVLVSYSFSFGFECIIPFSTPLFYYPFSKFHRSFMGRKSEWHCVASST